MLRSRATRSIVPAREGPGRRADSRLVVAKWCTLNGLREQALTEAREILKLKPGHRGATDLARSMEESLRQFPVAGTAPLKPTGALVTVVEPEPDVSPEGATSFVTRAQPILANQCMECHARADHASAFKLIRVTGFEVGPQATHANLRAVASQLKKDDPASSPLLTKALTAHGGMKQPPFVSRQAVAFRALESWVVVAIANASMPPMTPPAQPLIPPTAPVSPIPPATTLAQPSPTWDKPDARPVRLRSNAGAVGAADAAKPSRRRNGDANVAVEAAVDSDPPKQPEP